MSIMKQGADEARQEERRAKRIIAITLVWIGHVASVTGVLTFVAGIFAFFWPGATRDAANRFLDRIEAIHSDFGEVKEGLGRLESATNDIQDRARRIEGTVDQTKSVAEQILVTVTPVGALVGEVYFDFPCQPSGKIEGYIQVDNESNGWSGDVTIAFLTEAGKEILREEIGDVAPGLSLSLWPVVEELPAMMCFSSTSNDGRSVYGRHYIEWRASGKSRCEASGSVSDVLTAKERRMSDADVLRFCY